MTPIQIVAIVEGHGETDAVPILIQRICHELLNEYVVTVKSIRTTEAVIKKKPSDLANKLDLARTKMTSAKTGFVLVLADAEDPEDCPATLGPKIRGQARESRSDLAIDVVLVVREYETWFLAAAESLRGQYGFPADLMPPPDPEAPRDAKGWIANALGREYSPTIDQGAISRIFDLNQARANSASFDRLVRKIDAQIARIRGGDAPA